MKKGLYFFPVFSLLLLAAHFSRNNLNLLAIVFLFLPLLLFIKKIWIKRLMEIILFGGSIVWIFTIFHYVKIRIANGQSWIRLAIILGAVSLFTLFSAIVFEFKYLKSVYKNR